MNYELIINCLDLAEEVVIITDGDMVHGPKVLYVNDAFTKMTGYDKSEILGHTPHMLQGKSTSEAEKLRIRSTLEKGKRVRTELENYHKSGKSYWTELHISPIFDDSGQVQYFVSVQRDISENKHKEQLLEEALSDLRTKVNMLEQIHAATAHDLRAPIRAVHSFSQILEKQLGEGIDPPTKKYLGFIQSGIKNMASVVGAIHDFSLLTQPKGKREVQLSTIISSAQIALQKNIETTRAQLSVEGDAMVAGDESNLFLLFKNLLDNALKFRHPDRTPSVEVHISATSDPVEVLVRDNGMGIPPKNHEEIFRLFSKQSKDIRHEGVGAGLALCRKIALHHGGNIQVAESSEAGTVFKVLLSRG